MTTNKIRELLLVYLSLQSMDLAGDCMMMDEEVRNIDHDCCYCGGVLDRGHRV